MCTLAVYRGVSPDYPLIVVANRDEFLGRASTPPSPWPGNPAIVAGRDLVAGGTWLGCRRDGSGRVVGILNRRPVSRLTTAGPGELSRGNLCLGTLKAPSIAQALASLDASEAARYGGFNLFAADLAGALVVDNGDGVRRVDLDPGLSVLTNLDVNDPRCPRLAGATRRFEALKPMLAGGADLGVAAAALAAVLSSHDDGAEVEDAEAVAMFGREAAARLAMVCVHADNYGTRSSSMIFVGSDGNVRYLHASGAPCSTTFEEVPIRPAP